MKLSYLIRGLPGHPLHPPLTDATIGAYTAATVMGFASIVGVAEKGAAHGWWLALIVGLIFTVPTALSGFADWLTIEWGSPLWRTASTHLLAMVTATVFFLIAALVGHSGYTHGAVRTAPYILTLVGFGAMTLGGWLGGTVVFVHGMRVLNLVTEPAARAASPLPKPEKETAEGA
ncbi:MAG: DUF2231 domain-containing protein [Actinobacteria bacterium]|nr:MAG: DUF2231 domain-containing protein [Actinomycetota bacterium]